MKFKGSVDINKPQSVVADYFIDPQYAGEYQDGFMKSEMVSGEPGANGSVSKLYYKQGKGEMVLTETVTANNLPDTFEATYEHEHMDNTMKVTFVKIDENNTRYEYEFEYTRVAWVIPKIMFTLFPGMFKKQGDKWMRQFKEFVEKQ